MLALAGILILSSVLGGCSVVKAFIPDQSIDNALGLDQKQVGLSVYEQSDNAGMMVSHTKLPEPLSLIVKDFEGDIPAGLEPEAIIEGLGIAHEMHITRRSENSETPAQVYLSRLEASLNLRDGDTVLEKALNWDGASETPKIKLLRTSCEQVSLTEEGESEPVAATRCHYRVSEASETRANLITTTTIRGSEMDTLRRILTEGNFENTMEVSLSCDFEGDGLSLYDQFSATLLTSGGKLTF